MIAKPVWVVMRPVSKTKLVAKAAYFSKGAARNACVPNYADGIKEAWLLLDVPNDGKTLLEKHACNLPSRKPARKGVKRGK